MFSWEYHGLAASKARFCCCCVCFPFLTYPVTQVMSLTPLDTSALAKQPWVAASTSWAHNLSPVLALPALTAWVSPGLIKSHHGALRPSTPTLSAVSYLTINGRKKYEHKVLPTLNMKHWPCLNPGATQLPWAIQRFPNTRGTKVQFCKSKPSSR